ncbi:RHS repeat-associated core domain-containing protein [Gilliamella sp. wkB112]|uniref:RHS repeat-associated core domain-containing protein n=1 Tax=Gilliamella sp. wkB112 TaxID=3120257 RepID=UPI00080E8053|nr:RHS repeat-associated core domain-containing protein [Gilliamella apicola]OCG05709.1 hypothetical protein A9G12_00020 [Gilliamella apicola]
MQLLGENQNNLTSLYIYNDQSYEPLARIDGDIGKERINYFHTNIAGLPEQLTDQQGNSLWQADYEIWGTNKEEWHDKKTNFKQNLRYQGQYLDRETGLHYNTFRYYDPDIGRFTQPDPIGLVGGFNLYQYAPNPIDWIDPWGLKHESTTLGEDLLRVGSNQGGIVNAANRSNWRAHHIIPVKVWNDNAVFFEKIGYRDMRDSAQNGVFIPKDQTVGNRNGFKYYHAGNHGQYSARIRQRVEFVRQEFDAGRISRRQARREIRSLQRRYNRRLSARGGCRLLR